MNSGVESYRKKKVKPNASALLLVLSLEGENHVAKRVLLDHL